QEHEYDTYRDKMLRKRFLREEDVIDFGSLPCIPANEFVGAGIWQLYKAIESPYKSVLKLLLLEVYASTYSLAETEDIETETDSLSEPTAFSATEPLALTFKRAIYEQTPDGDLFDPYVM